MVGPPSSVLIPAPPEPNFVAPTTSRVVRDAMLDPGLFPNIPSGGRGEQLQGDVVGIAKRQA